MNEANAGPDGGADSDLDAAVVAIVCAQPWPCSEAVAVAWCESRLGPAAVDPEGTSWGLFQLHADTWRPYFGEERWAFVLDAAANVAMAYEIYVQGGGWGPWTCKP